MNPDSTVKRPGLSPRAKQILIGIGGVVALLLGAVLIYSVLVTPERQPYRDALSQYEQVYDANVAFISAAAAVNSSLSTDEQIEASKTAIQNAKATLQTQTDALGKQAVLTDGEGKVLYDAFAAKVKEYIAYNDTVLDSRQKVRPVLASSECSQALATEDAYADKVDAIRSCAEKFDALEDIGDADYRALVDGYAEKTAQLVTIFEKIADLKDLDGDDAARYDELVAEHDDVLADIEVVNTTFASDLQRSRSLVDITATAQALDQYLTRKSSVF